MNKNIIGIDISDFSIEAIVLKKKKNFEVSSYSRFRLSPDVVENGIILDKNKLKDSIKKLFKDAKPNEIKDKRVFISIPESKVYTRIIFLPNSIKDKDLKESGKLKAEEYIPEDINNLVTSIKILPPSKNYKEILYTGVEKENLNNFINIFKELGMEVVGCTMESISSFNGLNDKLKKKTTLLLDIGSRTTIASVFDKNGIRDSININIAGHKVSKSLMEKLQISHDSSTEKKRKIGLKKLDSDGKVMMAIQGQFQPLVDELKKFINFYEESNRQRIEQVILIGGSAQMPGIDEYFQENLNIDTTIGYDFLDDKLQNKETQSTKYINAIGLAKLAYNKKVDINFNDINKVNKWKREYHFLEIFNIKKILLFLLILSISGLLYYFQKDIFNFSIFDKKIEIYNQQFIVGIEEKDIDNYIVGNIINIPIVLENSYEELEYEKVLESIQLEADDDAISVKDNFIEENEYIIPYIFDKEIISIIPEKDSFNINDMVILEMNYDFISFNDNDFKNLILNNLSKKEKEEIKDWNIIYTDYFLIEFNEENNTFNIDGNIKLQDNN